MSAVIVSVRVKATPQEAFDVFTRDIAVWWRPKGLFQLTPRGDGALRFEPGEGGRLVTDLPSGKTFEIGQITDWRPGAHLAFTWRQATFADDQVTHVSVRFEPVDGETRVTVEHRGWDAIPQEHVARHGFPLHVFQIRQGEHWRALLAALAKAAGKR
ncbi:MAG: SRPBCC domain-containing protein [Terricaulis sp.]